MCSSDASMDAGRVQGQFFDSFDVKWILCLIFALQFAPFHGVIGLLAIGIALLFAIFPPHRRPDISLSAAVVSTLVSEGAHYYRTVTVIGCAGPIFPPAHVETGWNCHDCFQACLHSALCATGSFAGSDTGGHYIPMMSVP